MSGKDVLKRMNDYGINFIEQFEASLEKEYLAWVNAVDQEVQNFKDTGVLNNNFACNLIALAEPEEDTAGKEIVTAVDNSSKENESIVGKRTSQRTGRITRQALREPSQLVNQQHDLIKDKVSNVVVKIERLTTNEVTKYNENAALQVKKEQMDMPPPSKPIRQTKQTRKQKETEDLKIKTEMIEATQVPRDSDVVVQADNIVTLVVDTDEEEAELTTRTTRARTKNKIKNQNKDVVEVSSTTRSTRTKTRAAAMNKMDEIEKAANEQLKRLRDSSPEDDETQNKKTNRSKTKIRKMDNTIVKENTLQPLQTVVNKVNETFVCDNKDKNENKAVNTTVVIQKPTVEIPMNVNDLMTDDEDVSPAPTQHKQKLKNKPVFSPYENSPVKKKVEAYEKLGAASAASQMPIRSLRAKGKANDSEKSSMNKTEGMSVKSRGIPKAIHGSAEKHASKVLTPSTSALKSRSALKSSQAAFRERELARQQKEAEARQKKEALLQAESEEKRRRIEEKQLKAQQQRDALKKEKLKALEESERAKQEKIKKFSADQEDKLSKKKELNAQRYANAARKAAEEKGRQKDKVPTPKYLKYKTPLLPTTDCYDSDDGVSKPVVENEWQKKDAITCLATYLRLSKAYDKKFFASHQQSVDLQEIFPTIEAAKLKRTSSAIWNRSGMIRLASMMEEDDDL